MPDLLHVRRAAALAFGTLMLLSIASCADARSPAPSKATPAASAPAGPTEIATFAGGCFWSVENAFEGVPGVRSVVSGYTGGHLANPRYEDVGSGTTGHAESVEIRFDPRRVTYAQLLDRYWHFIDPMQEDGQICDHGDEYRTAIFWHDDRQRQLAEASKKRIAATSGFKRPIVTEIVPATPFYPAEDYHQDFAKKNPLRYNAYRMGCGRDRRLDELWGKAAVHPSH